MIADAAVGVVETNNAALAALRTEIERIPGHIRDQVRDILFAELENHFPDAIFEVRSDWPVGRLEWWEVVRMGLR